MRLTVVSNRSGTLYADGTQLGQVHGGVSVQLPLGPYRIWLAWQGGMSLPHSVDLDRTPVEVAIDAELELRIDAGRTVVVGCRQDCSTVLAGLEKRVEVARVIGVGVTLPDATDATDATDAGGDQRFHLIEVDTHTGRDIRVSRWIA